MKTYNTLYLEARSALMEAGIEEASFEAKHLVASASGKTLSGLMAALSFYSSGEIEGRVKDFLERRLRGEPLAYVTSSWEFYGIPLRITPDVLIPRADTEVLVDAAKAFLKGAEPSCRILDLCTGSGCIACALAKELPSSRITAADNSSKALDVCKKNVKELNLSSRIICMKADALSAPPFGLGSFDLIISNPPYIESSEIKKLDPSVKNYEPKAALDGGKDGLDFYRGIIKYWKMLLRENGAIIFEVGEGQAEAVGEMLLSAGFESAHFEKDTSGTDRAVIGIKKQLKGT